MESTEVQKIYIAQLSEVDEDIPPQAPTGHSMASIVQFVAQ